MCGFKSTPFNFRRACYDELHHRRRLIESGSENFMEPKCFYYGRLEYYLVFTVSQAIVTEVTGNQNNGSRHPYVCGLCSTL